MKLNIDTLQSYLQEEYSDRQFWLPPLQRIIKHKDRMNKWELKAVQQTLREIEISVKP